jgi:hypothetical protein
MTGANVGFKFQTARRYASAFSRRDAPEACISFTLLQNRGRRESRVPIAPAVVRTKNARVDHRFNRITPAFPAQWLTAYFVLSPVTGFLATVALRMTDAARPRLGGHISAKLDASVGASGPHDFTVRDRLRQRSRRTSYRPASFVEDGLQRRSSAPRSIAHGKTRPAIPSAPDAVASIASHRAFVTIASRPFSGETGELLAVICPTG